MFARDGNAGPFLDYGHDGFVGGGPIAGEGKAAVGQVADAHIDADDVLALLYFGSVFSRERQPAVLELIV